MDRVLQGEARTFSDIIQDLEDLGYEGRKNESHSNSSIKVPLILIKLRGQGKRLPLGSHTVLSPNVIWFWLNLTYEPSSGSLQPWLMA